MDTCTRGLKTRCVAFGGNYTNQPTNQWYTNIVQGSTNGTIGTNGNGNGTIGSPSGTNSTIGKLMVPLATNGTIGKITNGTIASTPNRARVMHTYISVAWSFTHLLYRE